MPVPAVGLKLDPRFFSVSPRGFSVKINSSPSIFEPFDGACSRGDASEVFRERSTDRADESGDAMTDDLRERDTAVGDSAKSDECSGNVTDVFRGRIEGDGGGEMRSRRGFSVKAASLALLPTMSGDGSEPVFPFTRADGLRDS